MNLPSTWEQGVTPTFRLQGAIQPCYQGMANEEPDSKVLQRTCKGTETISPLCQGQNPIPTIRHIERFYALPGHRTPTMAVAAILYVWLWGQKPIPNITMPGTGPLSLLLGI